MVFDIKLDLPEIIDPDDENNKLAGIYYIKGKLKVTGIYENMSFTSLVPDIVRIYDNSVYKIAGWPNIKTEEKYPDVDVDTCISSDD